MKDDDEAGGSPPCFACEMDAVYAGFLPAEELAVRLTRLLRLAEAAPDPVRARWQAVLEPALARLPEPAETDESDGGNADLVSAAVALLPRIADDRLHAALKALVRR